MDSNSFSEEIKSYIDSAYNEFRGYQCISLDILRELDRVCRNNGIDYFLAFGSLLGAIRDHTQIPWDYDIDTVVKIDDRDKLLDALKKGLGEDYYYSYSDIDETYPTSCLRVCKKGFSMMALHVDVFFLVGVPKGKRNEVLMIKRLKKLMGMRTTKNIHHYLGNNNSGWVMKVYDFIKNGWLHLIPNKLINRAELRLMLKYALTENDYWFACQNVYNIVFPKRIFDQTIEIELGGYGFKAPIGYDEFLTIAYGNWRDYLPVRKRFEEFYRMYYIVEERQSYYQNETNDDK